MTPTERRQKRLDEHLGQQEAKARWRADWWNSVAVAAAAVPGLITRDTKPPETFLESVARWNREDEVRREIDREENEAFNRRFATWWNETHPNLQITNYDK